MLKQTLAFMMMMSLLLGSANASAANGLSEMFDSFNYTLQVDGNEALAKANLRRDLEAARAQGISSQEMMSFALTQVKDASAKKEIAQTLALVNANNLSAEASELMVQDILSRSSNRGASWDGGTSALAFLGVAIIIAAAVYLINEDCKDTGVFEEEGPLCD